MTALFQGYGSPWGHPADSQIRLTGALFSESGFDDQVFGGPWP